MRTRGIRKGALGASGEASLPSVESGAERECHRPYDPHRLAMDASGNTGVVDAAESFKRAASGSVHGISALLVDGCPNRLIGNPGFPAHQAQVWRLLHSVPPPLFDGRSSL